MTGNDSDRESGAARWILRGGGEMADLIRRVDWAKTSLGPISTWPKSLQTTLAIMLHSRQPMFLWWGPELIQLYNDAYVPSFGLGKHPAAMGQRGRDCWPEIWPIIGPQIEAVMRDGTPSWHEDALVPIYRNGAIEEVYWTYGYSPVFDDEGAVGGTLVVCTETTARVLATRREAATRAEAERDRQRLQQFFAQAPAGICILRGPSLVFELANEEYHALVGRRELIGRPLLVAMPELEGQGIDGLLLGVMASGVPFVGREVPVNVDRQGRGVVDEAFYTFTYSPLRDANESVDAVIVLALDVTDEVMARRQTEELGRLLRESEAQFHLLAESLPQLAWSTRPDGYIDWYNRRWYEYTGTTFESMQGWGWSAVHDPERLDEVVTRWRASLAAGVPFEMEFPLRGRDGVFRWHLTRAEPLRDDEGRIVRWFGTNTDIDASRRAALERSALLESEQHARLAAEHASRVKDDFLSTASHELRTPLNAILGWARMLQSGQLDRSGYLRAIDSIERNARAQVRLIEDILDGSRIITGKLHLETRSLDMTDLVRAALDAVRPSADAKRIALTVQMDPAAARVMGDPERLQQVVWNLVNNAIKFTEPGGSVGVALRQAGTDLELKVTDTGRGIDAEFLPHVFERFRQADGGTTRRYGGLGLGLALVHHLVEAHRGTVHAASEGPGRGAAFTVTLPLQVSLADASDASDARQSVEGADRDATSSLLPNLNGVIVLVVDDEADARDLVATALRAKGAEVTTAASAAEALDLVSERAFMVMVSDIGMAGTDGYELIERIRTITGARGVHLPALALTAYSREEDRRRAIVGGFQAYATKPVEPEDIVRLVASLVTPLTPIVGEEPDRSGVRAHTLAKFEKILRARGVREALRFLNSRTPHRFTAIDRFDPPTLRNVFLFDADRPDVTRGEDGPMEATYSAIVGESQQPFTTEDARRDDRLRQHPARDTVLSYCGVLLRDDDGLPFGTLCHFDFSPCDVPVREMRVLESAAPLIMRALREHAASAS